MKIPTGLSKTALLIVTMGLFLCSMPADTCAQDIDGQKPEKKTVLQISSYHPGFPTFFQQIDGIKSVFKNTNIALDVEFMDSKRFYTETNLDNFYRTIVYKLSNTKAYDVIIVTDDNALAFVLEHQNELFDNIPIVFCGVNDVDKALAQNENSHVTGVIEAVSPETSYLVCPTLTRDIWDTCEVADKKIVYKKFTGLWGWVLKNRKALLTNAPADDPRSSGTPPGHAPIHRFLSAPALIDGTLVGQVAVANADHDYADHERDVIERLADLYAIAIQRLQAEEELKRHRDQLEELVNDRTAELEIAKNKAQQYLDIAGVILIAIDADRRVTLINQKGCEVLEGTAREIIGKDWFETFVPANLRQDVIRAFDRLMSGEIQPVEYFENPVLTQGGQERLIAWHNALLRDDSGNIVGTLSSGEDITEQKRVEKQITSLNQNLLNRTAALEAANKELEAFAYSVSHDLRAPLRHIEGFLELMQKKAGTAQDEQSRHYMEIISDSAKKMGLLIDDLLSFSRMGRQAMAFQQVDLRALVRDVIRELEPDATGRTIDWRIGDLPVVGGDAAMLRMVLANLVANALKFTRPRQEAQIEIGSQPGKNSEAVIFVRDNGVGFDMAYADKLFSVFHRLHRADEFEGTGIGLANVRRIITRHGGRTWAEGEQGQGAAFFFSLPRTIQRGKDEES